jgi:hypothetical protein
MNKHAKLLKQLQRAQFLYCSAYLYHGPEKEYLGLIQGLADAYCEILMLQHLLKENFNETPSR